MFPDDRDTISLDDYRYPVRNQMSNADIVIIFVRERKIVSIFQFALMLIRDSWWTFSGFR